MTTVQLGAHTLVLRDMQASDAPQVLALHQTVFSDGADIPWFDWKYGQSEACGKGQATGAWVNGELIAFCGGLPRTLHQQGHTVRGLQIGDVMVHPDWRSILTRRGPFFHVSENFYLSRLGTSGRSFQLGFGFPSERHLKLAGLLGLLHDDGRVQALHWTAQNTAPELGWRFRGEEVLPQAPGWAPACSGAWSQMLRHIPPHYTLGQRDLSYLHWRYVARTGVHGVAGSALSRQYRFLALRRRWSGQCAGLAVVRKDPDSGTLHWLDWIGAPTHMPLGLRLCVELTQREGLAHIQAWASQAVASTLEHTGIGQRDVCAGIGVPCASDLTTRTAPGPYWWLMGGDTDFL